MDQQFQKFVQFCERHLGSSTMKLLDLVKKRYNECDKEYKQSQEFSEYILCTEAKINTDKSRFFVHLRDFLNILKENKAEDDQDISDPVVNGTKRLHDSSESESDSAGSVKRRKLIDIERENKAEDIRSDEEKEIQPENSRCGDECEIQSVESGSDLDEENETAHSKDNKNIWETDINDAVPQTAVTKISEYSKDVKTPGEGNGKDVKGNVRKKIKTFDSHVKNDNNSTSVPFKATSKDIKIMFSSSEDESSEDNKISTNIENIIKRHEVKETPEQTKKGIIDFKETCQTNEIRGQSYVGSSTTSDLNATNASDNESESILNTSSESVVIIEEYEDQNLEKVVSGDESNCSKKLQNENHTCHTDRQNLINPKNLEPEKNKNIENGNLDSSTEVTLIDHDNSSEDNDFAMMADDTKDFGDSRNLENVTVKGDEEKKEMIMETVAKSKTKRYRSSSSDDEDPYYSLKAKKFREKCKKKYVISCGKKKKKKEFSRHSKDNFKPSANVQSRKDKSPVKKKTPNNSPKCKKKSSPKKSSPSKSPVMIMTDSESEIDIDDIEGFKKKFDEKVRTKLKKQFRINEEPEVVVEKISVKFEPMEDNDRADNMEGFVTSDELSRDVHLSDHENDHESTGRENVLSDKEFKGAEKSEKSQRTTEGQEKTRVSFVTEEIYKRKSDQQVGEKGDESSAQLDKDEHECEEIPHGSTKNDDEEPGTSSAQEGENIKKKGSTRQIRKLEKLLENIRNQIEKVRMRELDLDDLDSEISDYILEDKLQRKFMKVWDKLCELHKAVKSTGRPTEKYFRYEGTRYTEINRKIEKFINKKKEFPDYHDIRSLIMKVNKDKRLHLGSREIDDLSREAFTDVGNQLQRRRQKDFVSAFHTPGAEVNPFSLYDDPALYDLNLKKKLDNNKKSAKSNMDKVVEKYAALQYQVGDKTDDEDDEDEKEEEEEVDANIGIEDLDQLSGVDNSDSDNNMAIDDAHVFSVGHEKCGSGKTWKTGPCLEIENLESGQKSTFSEDNPADIEKLSPMKSRPELKRCDWSPKRAYFNDQLGLCPMPGKKDKSVSNVTVTILSDNDDDNEVKCSGENVDRLDDVTESSSTQDDDSKESADFRHCNKIECNNTVNDAAMKGDTDVKSGSKVVTQASVTVITDDEDESNTNDQTLGLKIVSACHVSVDDISKLHSGDLDVVEEVTKTKVEEVDVSEGSSHSSPVKFDLEFDNEIQSDTQVSETDIKLSAVNILPCSSTDKTVETALNEPEIIIIEETKLEPCLPKCMETKKEQFSQKRVKTNQVPFLQKSIGSKQGTFSQKGIRSAHAQFSLKGIGTNHIPSRKDKGTNQVLFPLRGLGTDTVSFPQSGLETKQDLYSQKSLGADQGPFSQMKQVSLGQTNPGQFSQGRFGAKQIFFPQSNSVQFSQKRMGRKQVPLSSKGIGGKQAPFPQKGLNDNTEQLKKFTWKTEVLPPRVSNHRTDLNHENKKVDSTSKTPQNMKLCKNSSGRPECTIRQTTGFTQVSRPVHASSKTKVPVKTNSYKTNEVVVIDCEETKESTKTPDKKPCNMKSISPSNTSLASDVIVIDTLPEVLSEATKRDSKSVSIDRTSKSKTSSRSKDECPVIFKPVSPKTSVTGEVPLKNLSKDQPVKEDSSAEVPNTDEIIACREKVGTDAAVKEKIAALTRTNCCSPEDIFTGSSSTATSNDCSSIELCDDIEIFEYPEHSIEIQNEMVDLRNKQNADANSCSGERVQDVSSAGGDITDSGESHSEDEKDITLCNQSEVSESKTSTGDYAEAMNVEDESKTDGEDLTGSDNESEVFTAVKREDLTGSDNETEVFTAVKLQEVLLDEELHSGYVEGMEEGEKDDPLDYCIESDTDRVMEENEDAEIVNGEGLIPDNITSTEIESNSDNSTVGPDLDEKVSVGLLAEVDSASEDEQEVTGGFEDDGKISSTSCVTVNPVNSMLVEGKLKIPDLKNKFLELKKAIVNSKPHDKYQEVTTPVSGSRSPVNPHWMEEDENASLIETYQEPDSTPYNLEENMISSSNSENIIVLSDSE